MEIQVRKEREETYKPATQTTMDRFFNSIDSILDKTKEIYKEMNLEGTVDNVMSIAAWDLFSSNTAQENGWI